MSDYLKNFAMMIPSYATHIHFGCMVHNATSKEWVSFLDYVISDLIQLKAEDEFIDLWINRDRAGLGRNSLSLQTWFDKWKNPPERNFTFTHHTYKK